MSTRRSRLVVYGAGACGGCDVALLGMGDRISMLEDEFEIVFWPCLTDFRFADLERLADGAVDLCLFDGALRTRHDVEMARRLRRKSRLLVAFGSCAHEGCVPALANLSPVEALLDRVFRDPLQSDNPGRILPGAAGPLALPALPPLLDAVRTLDQVVAVDYVVPGCPPEPPRVVEALATLRSALVGVRELPEAGSVLGAGLTTVCEECALTRREPSRDGGPRLRSFRRPFEVVPDGTSCLLDQALVCSGPATRAGCGALCPRVGMGCRGCYGPAAGVEDLGARLVAALAAVTASGSTTEAPAALSAEVEAAMATIVDPAGTLYRFGLAGSLLERARLASTLPENDVPHQH